MSDGESFLDTSVLMYLVSADAAKADLVEALLVRPCVISVQVLNEFAAVGARKLAMTWPEIGETLATVRAVCRVEPVSVDTHDRAVDIARRYRFSFYDALIMASALIAGCRTLYAQDLQHRQVIDRSLRVVDPFA